MKAIIYWTHTNFHSVCYHCRPVCGRLSVALLDSGELVLSSLQFQRLITTSMSEKQISVLPLLNWWDRCSPIVKPGWGSAVNWCTRLSPNPPWFEYRGTSACSLPTQPQVALERRQELAPQGMSVNDWAAMGGKEYEVVQHLAAIAQWQTFIRLGTVWPSST